MHIFKKYPFYALAVLVAVTASLFLYYQSLSLKADYVSTPALATEAQINTGKAIVAAMVNANCFSVEGPASPASMFSQIKTGSSAPSTGNSLTAKFGLSEKDIQDLIGGFISGPDDGCSKTTVNIRITYDAWMYENGEPPIVFLKPRINIKTKEQHLNSKCQVEDGPSSEVNIESNAVFSYNASTKEFKRVDSMPSGLRRVPNAFIIPINRTYTYGSLDPARCPHCKIKPTPTVNSTAATN